MVKKKLRLLVGIVNEKVEIIARALAAQNEFDVHLIGVGYKTKGLPSVMLAEERKLLAKLDEFIEISEESGVCDIQDIIGHVIKEKSIDFVMPLEDASTCLMADRKARYEIAGAVVLAPDYGNIEECTDKLKAARALKKYGFVVPRSSPAPKKASSIDAIVKILGGYPVIAKPRLGSGSMDTSIHYQRFSLAARLEDFLKEPYILQQYVNGRVYSVEIVSNLQGRVIATVPKLILATDGSVATCVQIRPQPVIQDLAARVARYFGLVGLSNIDILQGEDNQLYVIDVNPRISGSI